MISFHGISEVWNGFIVGLANRNQIKDYSDKTKKIELKKMEGLRRHNQVRILERRCVEATSKSSFSWMLLNQLNEKMKTKFWLPPLEPSVRAPLRDTKCEGEQHAVLVSSSVSRLDKIIGGSEFWAKFGLGPATVTFDSIFVSYEKTAFWN